ncbi:DnaB-like helicase C-terminal domain-containing protein [Metabacillus fastidiosus]|uniref:DnaB-like helicase C-terminal domain-containing protein n=1 Tax=Metabacillus fastidiosus TaxID=1458 RepID=UPI003D2B8A19
MYQDKMAIMQVLGCILKNPLLLADSSKYELTNDDFPEKFHKIIFGAINNLYSDGTEVINEVNIDGFLKEYDIQYAIFNDNDGIEYLYRIQELAEEGNFDYYYKRLKKFSLIREMDGLGFNVKELYNDEIIDPKEKEEMQKQFDQLSIEDILKFYETKMIEVKDKFKANSESQGVQAGEGVSELLKRLKESPDIGVPLNSESLTSIFRGSRKKKYLIRSAITGGGKTRHSVADACRLSATHLYNTETKNWEENDFNEHTVVISTEMLFEELQTIAIAYISAVDEEKILYNDLTEEENKRVELAAGILEKSPIWFEQLPNFNVKDIEQTIEKNVILNKVEYVYFDYIHSSVKVFSEMAKASGIGLREDQILLLMSIRLKDICNKYFVYLMSATQLNGEWKEAWQKGSVIDSTFIRGGKSIIDKADGAMIILPISKIEKKDIEEILKKGFHKPPNYVTHIFKNRGNRVDKAKVFSYVDMGTMRIQDLFVTNTDNEVINIKKLIVKPKKKEEEPVEQFDF